MSKPQQQVFESKLSTKILIGYLYFIQGIVLALSSTIPLTYANLPSYQTIGYFSAAVLPFSFKFITAPLIQKYTVFTYGRRKFWIVVGMITAAIGLAYVANIVMQEHKQFDTALTLFGVVMAISIQDISLDGLAVKQLKKPQLASLLQSVCQQIGVVAGSLLLGELTSKKFGQLLGFDSQIITVSHFIQLLIPLIAIPTLLIHFCFKQSKNQKQQQIGQLSLWQVTTHYRHFIMPRFRGCRQAFCFLVMFQGFNFFTSGYTIQLIKNKVLSKQFTITLGNLSLIVVFLGTYILSKYITKDNIQFVNKFIFSIRALIYALAFFINSSSPTLATIILVIMQLLGSLNFYIDGIVMNSFQQSKFQGMSVTMMASMCNLGRNSTLQLHLMGLYGFTQCCKWAFVYDAFIMVNIGKLHDWINHGLEQQSYKPISKQKKQSKTHTQ